MRPCHQWRSGDEIKQRRMLSIETAFIVLRQLRKRISCGYHDWSARNASSPQLFKALANTNRLFALHALSSTQFGMNEPYGLCQECQEDECGEKLRTSKAFAREI